MKLLTDGCEKMPHCADQEMSLGEQRLPNEIFTSSFIHHPSHFMIALANPPFNESDTALRDCVFFQTGGKLQVMTERQDNFRKDDDVRWQFGVPPQRSRLINLIISP